jgi:hypothetical protein
MPEPLPPPKAKPIDKASPSSASSTASNPKMASPESPPEISAEELEAFKNDPLIKKALEIFKAEILSGEQSPGI